ncbi:TetR family transcriptional regulator [Nocardiopsis sp. EMB25]|uniref:TetR family transcriptional regulator n=1 Tax=Nocardiopsis TaxID=2013 RepID=UPI00034CDCB7|nr:MULTISPECIES: TetR family transcriptional regulator [Nocardiopsis]MCY9783355.1 TetR family transcriptional regulator [Nocardiopsis sp. EMB25]
MERPLPRPESLRERKQRRTREAIIEAAHALFAERGFDRVTVNDIAERAEVGRATFFRYFGDKQEVIFSAQQQPDPACLSELVPPPEEPVGDSLQVALAHLRLVVAALVARLVEEHEVYLRHERLVSRHPELLARSLTKYRGYVEAMGRMLCDRGADRATAVLAAELALACFHAGRDEAADDPTRLPGAVDAAFARLLR